MKSERSSATAGRAVAGFLQRRLKLRQLRLLVVLEQHRHIGQAAVALNVTQPAISKSLAELEAGVGVPLFVRSPRGISPTEAGLCLIRHAQAVQEQMERAQQELEGISRGIRTQLRVGVLHGMPPLVWAAFSRFTRVNPDSDIRFAVYEQNMTELLAMLRARKVDLIIAPTPERVVSVDLHVAPLFHESMVWIAKNGHKLLRRKGTLRLSDIEDSLCVLPPQTARIRNLIDAEYRRHGAQLPTRLIETLSYPTLLGFVMEHGALALTTRHQARSTQALELVSPLDLPMPQVVMAIAATTLINEESAAATSFVEALRQVAVAQA